jgi:hypothetical protein
MKVGIVQVSLSVLHEFLKLPSTTKLLRVRQSWEDEQHNLFELMVEDPALDDVPEYQAIPWVSITINIDSHIKDSKVENYKS